MLRSRWLGLFQDQTGIAQSGKPGQSVNIYPLTAPFSFPSAGNVWFYHFSSSPGAGVGGLHTPKFSFFPSRCDPSTPECSFGYICTFVTAPWCPITIRTVVLYSLIVEVVVCQSHLQGQGTNSPNFWVSCLLKAHSWVPPMNFPPQRVAVLFKFTFPPIGKAFIQWHSITYTMAHLSCLNSGHLWRIISASELPVDWLRLLLHYSSTLTSAQSWFSQSHTPQ